MVFGYEVKAKLADILITLQCITIKKIFCCAVLSRTKIVVKPELKLFVKT